MSVPKYSRLLLIPALAGVCAGQTQLFEAARTGNLTAVRSLAADKSLIDQRDANGRTALHVAAVNCHPDAAQILVSAGWNRALPDGENKMPLALIANCPRETQALFYAFLAPGVQENVPWSLQYAAGRHQASVVSMLLNMHVDVNAVGSDGNRALDISCLQGDAEITKLLLEHGADPKLKNKAGGTPLHDAALHGNKDVIEFLLAHGADVNAVDLESRSTPLHYAAEFDRLDAVQMLVQHGAKVDLKNADGFTALQVAEKNHFEDVARFLASTKTR